MTAVSTQAEQKRLAVVGARIRKIREQRGLNLHELARLCGISASALSNIETGKRDLRVSSLYRIAAALRIDASKILEEAAEAEEETATGTQGGYDLENYKL